VDGGLENSWPGRLRSVTDIVRMRRKSAGWPHCHCQWESTPVMDDDPPEIDDTRVRPRHAAVWRGLLRPLLCCVCVDMQVRNNERPFESATHWALAKATIRRSIFSYLGHPEPGMASRPM
jgi:hypothetical protein